MTTKLRIFVPMAEQTASAHSDRAAADDAPVTAASSHSQPSAQDARAADHAWLRRWGEIREWRIIAFIVVPLAPLLGMLVGGWIGLLIALGVPLGALARLYALRCPECRSRFAEGRLTPIPNACAVCGTAFGDAPPQQKSDTSSDAARAASPTPEEDLARRIARWRWVRKQLAAVQIAASALGIVVLLDAVGRVSGEGTVIVVGMLATLAVAALGGLLLWHDRTGGVPVSLCYYALQVVLFRLEVAQLWIVLGPYALLIIGPEGPSASVGFTYGFANVHALGRASDWVGINVLALAAFWCLWRRPWREVPGLAVVHKEVPAAAAVLTRD